MPQSSRGEIVVGELLVDDGDRKRGIAIRVVEGIGVGSVLGLRSRRSAQERRQHFLQAGDQHVCFPRALGHLLDLNALARELLVRHVVPVLVFVGVERKRRALLLIRRERGMAPESGVSDQIDLRSVYGRWFGFPAEPPFAIG